MTVEEQSYGAMSPYPLLTSSSRCRICASATDVLPPAVAITASLASRPSNLAAMVSEVLVCLRSAASKRVWSEDMTSARAWQEAIVDT